MKKRIILPIILSVSMSLSLHTGKLVMGYEANDYSQNIEQISINKIRLRQGECTAVVWDKSFQYIKVEASNNNIEIATIFSSGSCYTYIRAKQPAPPDNTTEIRAYISPTEYLSLNVTVIVPSYDNDPSTSSTTPNTDSVAPTTTSISKTDKPSITKKPSATSAVYPPTCTSVTDEPYPNNNPPTETSEPCKTKATTAASYSPDGQVSSNETTVSSGNEDSFYGYVFSANEYGDVNSDGVVNINDLTRLALALLGDVKLNPAERFAADVIPSAYSIPDLADLATLKQYIMMENVVFGPRYIVYR